MVDPELLLPWIGALGLGGLSVKVFDWWANRESARIDDAQQLTGVALTLIDPLKREIDRLAEGLVKSNEEVEVLRIRVALLVAEVHRLGGDPSGILS